MLALVTSSDSATGLKLAELGEPEPAPHEALVSV
ncbi:MAG: oxidoreductase, partial [Mesorhizobium sp.]